MDARTPFDIESYFRDLCGRNRLAVEKGFYFCTCSGIESLQGPLQAYRTRHAFFCVDDTNDGSLVRGRNGGWFKKRTGTVFIMHRYREKDLSDRAEKLGWCRELFRQMMSRMLVDASDLSNEMIYLQTENVLARELGQYFMSGCTGLYFMFDISEPTDLVFDDTEWIS